jgi:hypothetical protein
MAKRKRKKETLADLSFERLKQVMFRRLHGMQSIGPAFDPRVGPEPFEWLSDEYSHGSDGLRDRMTAAMRELLHELTDVERWDEDARGELLDLIQDCGDGVAEDVERLVRTRLLLETEGAGPTAHAGLLKCLISTGHRQSREFWIEQYELLGPEYGALILSGLVEHGLEIAAGYLPNLCQHENAVQQIRLAIPILIDMFGYTKVVAAFQTQVDHLIDSVRDTFALDLGIASKPPASAGASPKLGTLENLCGVSGGWGDRVAANGNRLTDMLV